MPHALVINFQNTVVYAGARADRDAIYNTEFWHRGGNSGQGDFK